MSLFDNLKTSNDVEKAEDRLGGGGGPLESGVHDAKITLAYIDYAKSEAMSLNLHFDVGGNTLRQTLWMTSGKAKGCKNYYTDRNGKNQYLPGFIVANDLALLAADTEISGLDHEEKAISLYDYEAKKEVPQKKIVLPDLMGQSVKLGVLKQVVDKTAMNEATNEYEPTGETREVNEIVKVFHSEFGVTVTEAQAGEREPGFMTRWAEKNTGKTVNRAKGAKEGGPTAGAPAAAAAAPKKSLFS